MTHHHTSLLNSLIERFKLRSYLEIGVQNPANNFDKIKTAYRVGVDPEIQQSSESGRHLFDATSDYFFNDENNLRWRSFDLIFIDGDHTKEQARKDFENALRCLSPGGFIVLHDTRPTDPVTTCVPRGSQKIWHGDVYKFAMTLPTYSGIRFVTYNWDCGCTVVWEDKQAPPVQMERYTLDETWDNYKRYGDRLMNVVPDDYVIER